MRVHAAGWRRLVERNSVTEHMGYGDCLAAPGPTQNYGRRGTIFCEEQLISGPKALTCCFCSLFPEGAIKDEH